MQALQDHDTVINAIDTFEVKNAWEDSRKNDRLNFSVPLLLTPFSDNLLSVQDCNGILLATFRYIKKSQREL